MRNFMELLRKRWEQGYFACVGLDTKIENVPDCIYPSHLREKGRRIGATIVEFNRRIVEATQDRVCAYKPNTAFYERHGSAGWEALHETIKFINFIAPEIPVILDAKRADIGNTNNGYVDMLNMCGADAITVHPYLGRQALQPFLDQKDKGVIVLCRTSNPGADEFQDVCAGYKSAKHAGVQARPLFEYVAHRVSSQWNENGNCALVVGATYPDELATVRSVVGDMTILIPGIGAQGGDVEATVRAGKDSRGQGMIINSSRAIIFASDGPDFGQAARRETERIHNEIHKYL